jgi:DNA-binding transcriptional LysR family regulator
MVSRVNWEIYRSFLAALTEGSLSGAARALGVAQPTVGRHIVALERALHVTLFTRSQTGLLPTETALELRRYAEAMNSTAAALERAAASDVSEIRGVVRLTASEIVGVEVLPPILARLRAGYPALQLELVLSNRMQDLLQREADIAVRMARPRQALLIARRIGRVEVGLHAAPQYLERCGVPAAASDLAEHTIIGFDRMTPFIRAAGKTMPLRREDLGLRADSDLAQLALLRAGAGIGFCQLPIGRRDGLVRVLPRQFSLSLEVWVVMHRDLRGSPRCRVTFDALVEGLERYLARASQ